MRQVKQAIKALLPTAVVRNLQDWRDLPAAAKAEKRKDASGNLGSDVGPQRAIELGLDWLVRAQEHSRTADGGVARDYSLLTGWSSSYPETTGYIVPTFLTPEARAYLPDAQSRARRMLDFFVSIQLADGGFQGGLVDAVPRVSVTFNTGQILLGLAAGVRDFGDERYVESLHRAAAFLRDSLDADGCWRRFATPFAAPGDKTYETHVAWGLFEADRVAPGHGYADAGHRQVAWALKNQTANGWLRDCCLDDPEQPLTHTLGYAVRGFIEAHRHRPDPATLRAIVATATPLARHGRQSDGFLPGRFDSNWNPRVRWSCLTGAVQLAACWFDLYELTGDALFLDAARRTNAFVRRTLAVDGSNPDVRGAVKGSYPVDGDYGRFQYLNWAAKFMIDSNIRELQLARRN